MCVPPSRHYFLCQDLGICSDADTRRALLAPRAHQARAVGLGCLRGAAAGLWAALGSRRDEVTQNRAHVWSLCFTFSLPNFSSLFKAYFLLGCGKRQELGAEEVAGAHGGHPGVNVCERFGVQ